MNIKNVLAVRVSTGIGVCKMIKWAFGFVVILSWLSSATSSFLHGQPCSDRNTAYLYPTTTIMPKDEANCVDITGFGDPNEINPTDFPQLALQANTLYADHMNLSRFPALMVYSLPRLETIDLSGNSIRRLPYKMYKAAPRLSKLLLSENQIFVPRNRALFKSVTIKMLMLSKNRISNIYPVTFSKMHSLEILYLDGNRLKQIIPEMFLQLPQLQYLHLGQNLVAEFPPKRLMPVLLRYYIIKDQRRIIK